MRMMWAIKLMSTLINEDIENKAINESGFVVKLCLRENSSSLGASQSG